MPTRYIFLIGFFTFTVFHCWGIEDPGVSNRFQPGKTYDIEQVTQISTITSDRHFLEQPDSHITIQYQAVTTEESNSRNLSVNVQVTEVKAGIMQEGQIYEYNSSDPAKSPPAIQQLFGGIKEKKFTLVYSTNLDLIKIDAADDDSTPLAGMSVMTSRQLAESFHLQQMASLPKKQVKKGDDWTWQCKLVLPPMPEVEYTGKSKRGDATVPDHPEQAVVEIEGTLKSQTDGAAAGSTLPELKDAKFTGTQIFDTKQGLLIQSKVTCEFSLSVNGMDLRTRQHDSCRLVQVTDNAQEN